ncbi:SKP2 protein, partial [Polyodon spathula]|nr:SKP2 protein [Polyodon spathula]
MKTSPLFSLGGQGKRENAKQEFWFGCWSLLKPLEALGFDESLWYSVDLTGKALLAPALSQALSVGVVALRCPRTCIGIPSLKNLRSLRVQHLDLSSCTMSVAVLEDVIGRCCRLRNLSLEGLVLSDQVLICLAQNPELLRLNLSGCSGFSAHSLGEMLHHCTRLEELNLSWCEFTSDHVKAAVNNIPESVTQLNLSGYRQNLHIADVEVLVERCPNITNLDLSDSVLLTSDSFQHFCKLPALHHLALSRCYQIHPAALVDFENFPSLKMLEVFGILQDTSLPILTKGLPHIKINSCYFTTIARPTVGSKNSRDIWGISCRLTYRAPFTS